MRFPREDDDARHLIWFGDAERVAVPIDDKHAGPGTAQLWVPGLARLPRRVQRERECDDADRAWVMRGTAGNPRTVRAAALGQAAARRRHANVPRRSTSTSSAQAGLASARIPARWSP